MSIKYRNETKLMYSIYPKTRVKTEDCAVCSEEGVIHTIMTTGMGHEGIFGKCKPYFDFDFSYDTEEKQIEAEYSICQASINEVVGFCGVNAKDIHMLTANGYSANKRKWVNSIHIIVPNSTVYSCGKELLNSMRDYDMFDIEPDYMVYKGVGKRQCFRLPYCSKEGETRPFVYTQLVDGKLIKLDKNVWLERFGLRVSEFLVSEETTIMDNSVAKTHVPVAVANVALTDEKYGAYIDAFNASILSEKDNHIFRSATETKDGMTFINMNRLNASRCDWCRVIHDVDNSHYIMIHQDGSAFAGCWKYKGKEIPKRCIVKSKTPLTKNEIIQNCIEKFHKEEDKQDTISEDIKELGFEVFECDNKYCTDIKMLDDCINGGEYDILGLRSNMGTGKSYMMAEYVAKLVKRYPTMRICIVSNRISLASKYKQDYEGFVCYLDDRTAPLKSNLVICQMDSLHRIQWGRTCNEGGNWCDLLLLDEADQTLKHMASKTYMANRNSRKNNAMFSALVKTSKNIVAMSANLNPWCMKRLTTMRGELPERQVRHVFVWNKATTMKQHIVISPTQEDIIKMIAEDLKENRKVYLSTNIKIENIHTIERLLSEKSEKKILAICRDTLSKPNVIDALNKPNEEWGKYDMVICSPSVQGGVSYDVKDTFHAVYGIFINLTNSPDDACQMLRRIRHPISDQINISFKKYNCFNGITNRDEYINHLIASRRSDFNDIKNLEQNCEFSINTCGEVVFRRSEYFNMYVDIRIQEAYNKRNWLHSFMLNQKIYGNDVSAYKMTAPIVNKVIKKGLKVSKELNADDRAELLEKTVLLTDEQYMALMVKKEHHILSDEETAQYRKFRLYTVFGVEQKVKLTKAWYKIYDNDSKMKEFQACKVYYVVKNRKWVHALNDIKKEEAKRNAYNRSYLADAEGGYRDAVDNETAILKSLCHTNRYDKHRILTKWVNDIGFTHHGDVKEIPRGDLIKGLRKIYKETNMEGCANILGKRKDRFGWKSKPESKTFVRDMLRMTNSCIKSGLYCSIGQKSTSRADKDIFVMKCSKYFSKIEDNDDFKPALGRMVKEVIEE